MSWPYTRASVRHQVDILVSMIRRGLDPERLFSFDWETEPVLHLAREVAAGE